MNSVYIIISDKFPQIATEFIMQPCLGLVLPIHKTQN